MKTFLFILFCSSFAHGSDPFLAMVKNYLDIDPGYNEQLNLKKYNKRLELGAKTKLFLPELSFSHSNSSEESITSTEKVDSKLSRLSLSYSLFNFGSDYELFKSRKSGYQAFQNKLKGTLIERESSIIRFLLNKTRVQKNLDLQNEIISLKEKILEISFSKFKRGTLSKNDLTRVKIDLSNAKSDLIAIQENLNKYIIELNGYDLIKEKQNKKNKFPWVSLFKKSGISKVKALKLNELEIPSLQELKFKKESQLSSAKSLSRNHLGRFSLKYARDLYKTDDTDDLYGWSASIVYTLPIFENFDKDIEIQKAKAYAKTAQLIYEHNKKRIVSQEEMKKELLNQTYENFNNRIQIQKEYANLLKNVIKRFKKGVVSVNDLFIEQDRLVLTKKHTDQTIFDLHIRYMDLLHDYGISLTTSPSFFK